MTEPKIIVYEQPALWQSRSMQFRTSISIDPEAAKIAQKMSADFGYNNFSKLIEDLILSAAQATEVVLLPSRHGKPPIRLFVVPHPGKSGERRKL